jgi:hypothetical protein
VLSGNELIVVVLAVVALLVVTGSAVVGIVVRFVRAGRSANGWLRRPRPGGPDEAGRKRR